MRASLFLAMGALAYMLCSRAAWSTDEVFDPRDSLQTISDPSLFEDTRVVTYDYDPNRTYPVRARVKVFTEIAVPNTEKIIAWYPSADDKRGWPYIISADKRHLFVMPLQAGSVNSATLITEQHSYLLTFEAVSTGIWFQRVTWTVTDDNSVLPSQFEAENSTNGSQDATDQSSEIVSETNPDLHTMFVGYHIQGDAAFAPDLVADDGKFTWFRLPAQVQELPALFVLNDQKQAELVNYTVDQNGLMKAQRTAPAWLLKLGDDEVRVTLKSPSAHSWLEWLHL